MKLFEKRTISESIDNTEGKAIITLADQWFSTVIQGAAPMTAIVIDQKVDYSISKGLNLDFFVTTFGDAPVSITIRGMSLLKTCEDNSDARKQITELYTEKKLSAENDARIKLGIASSNNAPLYFTCVWLGLEARSHNDSSLAGAPSYEYTINLIGVPSEGGGFIRPRKVLYLQNEL